MKGSKYYVSLLSHLLFYQRRMKKKVMDPFLNCEAYWLYVANAIYLCQLKLV